MRSSFQRTTASWAGLLAIALCVATFVPSSHASAQALTTAGRARIARSLALSTVEIQCGGWRGSGFVVGSERWIVSTFHVVETAAHVGRGGSQVSITVVFGSGTRREARLVETDPDHDLALMEIVGGHVPAPPLTLADSDPVAAGQPVLVYGAPLGGPGAVTEGLVTGRSDLDLATAPLARQLITTDASILPVVSGGPLVDRRGRVVGVSWAGHLHDELVEAVAIPANYVRELLARERAAPGPPAATELRLTTPVVQAASPPALLASGLVVVDLRSFAGVRVVHVVPASPASRARIVGGDEPYSDATAPWVGPIITGVDQHPIANVLELEAYLAGCTPGQVVQLSLRASVDASAETGQVSMTVGTAP